MRLAELAGIEIDDRLRACHAALDPEAPGDFRELAALLACSWAADPPSFVGLSGGQGAGKSTLGRLVEAACAQVGLRGCVLSLDDFYLSRSERRELAMRVHPLFETRGPPGTHDMGFCRDRLWALRHSGEVDLPVFDKGIDDRAGLRRVTGPFDVVVLEGWCVGGRAAAKEQLVSAVNRLEADCDPDGSWRRSVNAALADLYAPIWEMLEEILFFRVPSLEAIKRWRLEQEEGNPAGRRMDAAQVERFVEYFERLTRAMLEDLPGRADWLVELDETHRVAGLSRRGR